MKKLMMCGLAIFMVAQSFAQNTEAPITKQNSWLKAGVNVGLPVGNISNYTSATVGGELSAQAMATPNLGLGVASGYTHYFGKNGFKDLGTIPLGALIRYYPASSGFFAGTDVGYSFITSGGPTGGAYIKPQIGYHNYDWNLYGFYNQVFVGNNGIDLQNVGVSAVYNIRFK